MMPHERYRTDLERAVGRNPGRFFAGERWADPLDLVCQANFFGNKLPDRWFSFPNNSMGWSSDNRGWHLTCSGSGAAYLTWGDGGNATGISSSLSGFGQMAGFTRSATLLARIRIPTAAENTSRHYAGLTTATTLGQTDVDALDGIYVGMDGRVSTSHLCAITRKNGVATIRALNGDGDIPPVPHSTTDWYDVAVVCDPLNSQLLYYVDNQLAASLTTDIPSSASDRLVPWFHVQAGGAVSAKQLDVLSVVAFEGRP